MYNDKIKDIEDKIPDIANLATNTTLNTKINEVKNEIPLKKEQKKQIMMQKYQKWEVNILLLQILISSQVIYLVKKQHKQMQLINMISMKRWKY